MFGMGEILVLISLGVLIFGWRKFPQVGSALGRSIRDFKKAIGGQDDRPIKDVEQLGENNKLPPDKNKHR